MHKTGDGDSHPREPVEVALFVTCLVDLFRPSVGFAAIRLLEAAGCSVAVPAGQTCCGQPAYNSGDRRHAAAVAARALEALAPYRYVVVPSGSCAAMIRLEYPRLFADDRERLERAREVAGRTHELVSFLTDVRGMTRVSASCDGCAAYHDGCSGLRDLEIHRQPRQLLASVAGLRLVEVPNGDRCCGFGGTFSVKYSDISLDMVSQKTADVRSTGADLLLAGDLGCLLNIAGRLAREGSSVSVRHVAEVLDGQLEAPPIGRARGDGR